MKNRLPVLVTFMCEGRETVCERNIFWNPATSVVSGQKPITPKEAVELIRLAYDGEEYAGVILFHHVASYRCTVEILKRELVPWVFPVSIVLVGQAQSDAIPASFEKALSKIHADGHARLWVCGQEGLEDFGPTVGRYALVGEHSGQRSFADF